MFKILLLTSISFGPIATASAAEQPTSVESCRSIAEPKARLSCYDAALPPAPAEAVSAENSWQVNESTSAVDGTKTLFFTLAASDVTNGTSSADRFVLGLACSNLSTSVFVATPFYLGDPTNVTVRLPDQEPDIETHMWDVSTSGETIGLWNEQNAITFIRSLKDDGKFAIRVAALRGFEAVFKLGKVEIVAEKIATACSWKL